MRGTPSVGGIIELFEYAYGLYDDMYDLHCYRSIPGFTFTGNDVKHSRKGCKSLAEEVSKISYRIKLANEQSVHELLNEGREIVKRGGEMVEKGVL